MRLRRGKGRGGGAHTREREREKWRQAGGRTVRIDLVRLSSCCARQRKVYSMPRPRSRSNCLTVQWGGLTVAVGRVARSSIRAGQGTAGQGRSGQVEVLFHTHTHFCASVCLLDGRHSLSLSLSLSLSACVTKRTFGGGCAHSHLESGCR